MRALSLLVAALFFAGCEETTFVDGPDLVEDGVVAETLHVPHQSTTDVSPGLTTNGDLTINFHTTTFPERWNVVIKCQHGKFVLDSEKHDIAQGVWEKVVVGDRVKITYHAVARVVSEDGVEKSRTFEKFVTTRVIPVPREAQ